MFPEFDDRKLMIRLRFAFVNASGKVGKWATNTLLFDAKTVNCYIATQWHNINEVKNSIKTTHWRSSVDTSTLLMFWSRLSATILRGLNNKSPTRDFPFESQSISRRFVSSGEINFKFDRANHSHCILIEIQHIKIIVEMAIDEKRNGRGQDGNGILILLKIANRTQVVHSMQISDQSLCAVDFHPAFA